MVDEKLYITKFNPNYYTFLKLASKVSGILPEKIDTLKWSNSGNLIAISNNQNFIIPFNNKSLKQKTQNDEIKLIVSFKNFLLTEKKNIEKYINNFFKFNLLFENFKILLTKKDECLKISYNYGKTYKKEISFYSFRINEQIYGTNGKYKLDTICNILVEQLQNFINENKNNIMQNKGSLSKDAIDILKTDFRKYIVNKVEKELYSISNRILIKDENYIYCKVKQRDANSKLTLDNYIFPNQDFKYNNGKIETKEDEIIYIQNLANKIYGDLQKQKLYFDICMNIEMKKLAISLFNKYIVKVNTCLNGLKKINLSFDEYYSYFNDVNTLYLETDIFIVKNHLGSFSYFYKDNIGDYLEQTNTNDYKNCYDYILKHLEGYILEYKFGYGLLNGTTTFSIKKSYWQETYEFTMQLPSYLDSNWQNEFLQQISQIKISINEEHKNKMLTFEEQYNEIVGYYLVRDIIRILNLNKKNKYITIDIITKELRNKQNSELSLHIENQGIYKGIITSKNVEYFIKKLINYKFVKKNKKYIEDNILETYTLKDGYENLLTPQCCTEIEIKNKIEQNLSLTDDESYCLFKSMQNKTNIEIGDYIDLLNCVNSYGFISYHKEDFIEFMKNSPKEFLLFLDMKKSCEKNELNKKIFDKILTS